MSDGRGAERRRAGAAFSGGSPQQPLPPSPAAAAGAGAASGRDGGCTRGSSTADSEVPSRSCGAAEAGGALRATAAVLAPGRRPRVAADAGVTEEATGTVGVGGSAAFDSRAASYDCGAGAGGRQGMREWMGLRYSSLLPPPPPQHTHLHASEKGGGRPRIASPCCAHSAISSSSSRSSGRRPPKRLAWSPGSATPELCHLRGELSLQTRTRVICGTAAAVTDSGGCLFGRGQSARRRHTNLDLQVTCAPPGGRTAGPR